MGRLGALLLAMCLGACASAARPAARVEESTATPRRCSPGDPDRWAWFCVVGQILYGAATFFQPVDSPTGR